MCMDGLRAYTSPSDCIKPTVFHDSFLLPKKIFFRFRSLAVGLKNFEK